MYSECEICNVTILLILSNCLVTLTMEIQKEARVSMRNTISGNSLQSNGGKQIEKNKWLSGCLALQKYLPTVLLSELLQVFAFTALQTPPLVRVNTNL